MEVRSMTFDQMEMRASLDRAHLIEREVFWQSVFYLSALYLTWPILIFATNRSAELLGVYGFWLAVYTLVPLQGALNAIVYFRPRVWRHNAKRRRLRSSGRGGGTSRVNGTNSFCLNRESVNHADESHNSFSIDETAPEDFSTFDIAALDERIEPSALIAGDIDEELKNFEHSRVRVSNLRPPTIPEEGELCRESSEAPPENSQVEENSLCPSKESVETGGPAVEIHHNKEDDVQSEMTFDG
uniref:Uncharacterized protein n=1 Tax=Cyclophora tenuis TaxID=216820 RepID=A0A7S1GLW7_CYCTE